MQTCKIKTDKTYTITINNNPIPGFKVDSQWEGLVKLRKDVAKPVTLWIIIKELDSVSKLFNDMLDSETETEVLDMSIDLKTMSVRKEQ